MAPMLTPSLQVVVARVALSGSLGSAVVVSKSRRCIWAIAWFDMQIKMQMQMQMVNSKPTTAGRQKQTGAHAIAATALQTVPSYS
jgi:hypothetical protein